MGGVKLTVHLSVLGRLHFFFLSESVSTLSRLICILHNNHGLLQLHVIMFQKK